MRRHKPIFLSTHTHTHTYMCGVEGVTMGMAKGQPGDDVDFLDMADQDGDGSGLSWGWRWPTCASPQSKIKKKKRKNTNLNWVFREIFTALSVVDFTLLNHHHQSIADLPRTSGERGPEVRLCARRAGVRQRHKPASTRELHSRRLCDDDIPHT